MDFKGMLDIVENFAVGLIIVIPIVAILLISFFIWNFIPRLLKTIPDLTVLILPIIIVVSILLMVMVIYYIGKFLKKPFKNKLGFDSENEVFCKNCGKKLPNHADFCDSCGVKLQ